VQFGDAAPAVALTIPDRVPTAIASGIRRVVTVGEAAGAIPLSEVLACDAASTSSDAGPGDMAALPYSSGTTGLPKGVMLTHGNLVTICRQLIAALEVRPDDVTLALAPFFHILGFIAELALPLAAGATVVTMPHFDPIGFLDLLERHRVTYLTVPPPVGAFLARHPAILDRNLSSLDLVAVGGASFPADTHRALADRLPWCAIGQGWGLTETTGAVCVPRRGEGTTPGSVGCLLPETELRVIDLENGDDLGPGHDGELWVRGPQVMAGYLGLPGATAQMIDGAGWLRTGDLGHIELTGEVIIVDRLRDLIKVDGFQVAPAELEAVLVSHPSVQDAAVTARRTSDMASFRSPSSLSATPLSTPKPSPNG
jgi:acyl-CoA synthetase (AMP-forming)/AMP-acid ligase II